MRKVHFLFVGIFLALSFSVNAMHEVLSNRNSTTDTLKGKNLYKLITTGQENEIKQYFRIVSFDELVKSDSGTMVRAINKLKTNDKVTRTIWILEEVKSRPVEIRCQVYNELGKVEYNKPSFFLKQMINNYFTNFIENEDTLLGKVSVLQKKMNR